jgi:hypothetical protein
MPSFRMIPFGVGGRDEPIHRPVSLAASVTADPAANVGCGESGGRAVATAVSPRIGSADPRRTARRGKSRVSILGATSSPTGSTRPSPSMPRSDLGPHGRLHRARAYIRIPTKGRNHTDFSDRWGSSAPRLGRAPVRWRVRSKAGVHFQVQSTQDVSCVRAGSCGRPPTTSRPVGGGTASNSSATTVVSGGVGSRRCPPLPTSAAPGFQPRPWVRRCDRRMAIA